MNRKIVLTLEEEEVNDKYEWAIDIETTNMTDKKIIEVLTQALMDIARRRSIFLTVKEL